MLDHWVLATSRTGVRWLCYLHTKCVEITGHDVKVSAVACGPHFVLPSIMVQTSRVTVTHLHCNIEEDHAASPTVTWAHGWPDHVLAACRGAISKYIIEFARHLNLGRVRSDHHEFPFSFDPFNFGRPLRLCILLVFHVANYSLIYGIGECGSHRAPVQCSLTCAPANSG